MNKAFNKRHLEEVLSTNNFEISEEEKENFLENCTMLTSDVHFYYNLNLNTKNKVGILYLKEKYPNNFILKELLENQIKCFDLNQKENMDKLFKLGNIFSDFYYLYAKDFQREIENMSKKENRKLFCKNNSNIIKEYEQKYFEIVEDYKMKDKQTENLTIQQ